MTNAGHMRNNFQR